MAYEAIITNTDTPKGTGTYAAGATSATVAIALVDGGKYALTAYNSNSKMNITSFTWNSASQITVNFRKQADAGTIYVVARKVG